MGSNTLSRLYKGRSHLHPRRGRRQLGVTPTHGARGRAWISPPPPRSPSPWRRDGRSSACPD
ncbi:hypothetical protein C7M71_001275 [Peterkaempfera bronchialis]|uniref:Uncharacterized protein n=1 Tax=Peterkaempfera bronchialis TaxID=2126346 RepID=A0A345SRF8_9ACTN|nr:hypothetical protein C7M71_001275 [Peterkaempfera bronchialis]